MKRPPLLFLNVLIVATCGLIYELLAGTLASYVLGDSVTQFSLIIGIYLFAMGVGSWLSRFIDKELARRFVDIELAVAVLGGFSAPLLFLSFSRVSYFYVVLYVVVFLIGVFVGLEIPILLRILKDEIEFKELVSRVLAFDYVGALVASILFPILFVPRLGLIRTSLIFGMLNAGDLVNVSANRRSCTSSIQPARSPLAIPSTAAAISGSRIPTTISPASAAGTGSPAFARANASTAPRA